jgi:hypothetical protein
MAKEVAAAILGALAGLGAGYVLPSILPKPKIAVVTVGGQGTFKMSGFPPNTALMSMGGGTNGIGSAPYNLGSTDQNGNLTVSGAEPSLPSGTVVLYVVYCAQNPKTFATAIIGES